MASPKSPRDRQGHCKDARAVTLRRIDFQAEIDPLKWAVEGLIVRGFINVAAALAGTGKTALLTSMIWQASRPYGGYIAGFRVNPTTSIYLDYDAPGDFRNLRFWLDKHRTAYPDGDQSRIIALEPDSKTPALNQKVMQQVINTAHETHAGLIVVDSFMASFPTVDPVRASAVLGPMTQLRKLATDTDAAVVIVDHLPKPMLGEAAGARGVLGSVAKTAQARSVHIITDVPKDKTNGARVLQWRCEKMSFARKPEPFGLEMIFDNGAVRFEPFELPDDQPTTKATAALGAIRDHLENHEGELIARKALIATARHQTGASQRTAELALSDLQLMLGNRLTTTAMPGRGQPTAYRLHSLKDSAGNKRNTVQEKE